MSSESLTPRTRVYLSWTKDRYTGCRQVLFSGQSATTQLVWDAGKNHFSTTDVFPTGWHSGMLLGDDFDVAPVEPFLIPPSDSCLDIEITTSHPRQSSPLCPPINPIVSPLPKKIFSPPISHQSPSSSVPINRHKDPLPSDYGRLEECYTRGSGEVPGRDIVRHFSESDNYFDHLIRQPENDPPPKDQLIDEVIYRIPTNNQPVNDAIYRTPPNNQPVDDAIYRTPPNNQPVDAIYRTPPNNQPVDAMYKVQANNESEEAIYITSLNNQPISQSPSNRPAPEVLEEHIPRKHSGDHSNENGASSGEEECYQIPLTHISRPKDLFSFSSEVRIPSHYDTCDRPLFFSKTRQMSRVLSPLDTSESPSQEMAPSSRAHMLKRGPIPHKRTHSKPMSPLPSPDTPPPHRNAESEEKVDIEIEKEQLIKPEIEKEQLIKQEIEKEQLIKKEIEKEQLIKQEIEKAQLIKKEIETEQKVRRQEVEREQLMRQDLEREKVRRQEMEREQLMRQDLEREKVRRQEMERELLWCKTEGEVWRSKYEETAQRLSLALSQLETEKSAVRILREEISDVKADSQPISSPPVIEVSRPAVSKGRAPQITKPKPVIPKAAKRAVK